MNRKRNPILIYLPLLILYLGIIGLMYEPEWTGDEERFLYYAQNLSHGFYADAANPEFRNGPGYPMFLSLFVKLGLPHIVVVLTNALLLLAGVRFFHLTLQFFLPHKTALYLSYFMGTYPVMLKELPLAVYESFYFCLVCAFFYYFLGAYRRKPFSFVDFMLPGALLGMLALTRFVYGYSVFYSLPILGLVFLFRRNDKVKSFLITLGVAALFCIPYLLYTYSLSGKVFHWGTNGGEVLYWMSSTEEGEWGDWQSREEILNDEIPDISPVHKEFYQTLVPMSFLERDAALKARSKENILGQPQYYLKHWFANVNRLFMGFPKSFRQQDLRPIPYICWNLPILIALLLSLLPAYRRWREIPGEFLAIWVLYLLYLAFTSIVHAVPRYLVSVVPFWIIWIGYIFHTFTEIRLNLEKKWI